jgi:hypothetical protein
MLNYRNIEDSAFLLFLIKVMAQFQVIISIREVGMEDNLLIRACSISYHINIFFKSLGIPL